MKTERGGNSNLSKIVGVDNMINNTNINSSTRIHDKNPSIHSSRSQ